MAVAVAIVVFVQRNKPDATNIEIARSSARAACTDLAEVVRQVAEDESFERVLETIQAASSSSNKAAALDPLWRPLAGAVGAVRVALEEDDPHAAAVGLRVADGECARAGVPLKHEN